MKIIHTTAILFILLCQVSLYGQNTFTTQVKYADETSPSGNALLLSKVDSTFITGTFFIDGELVIENIPSDPLLLKLTSIEFRDTIIDISNITDSQLDMPIIYVKSTTNTLGEVTIKAKRPSYIQRPDGSMEVQVTGTTLAASSSVEEIISKSPEVLIDENGGISILGRGSAIIFLDNQKVSADQLSLLIPSQVKSVQIYRNPPPKFDAEGGAVIVIKTMKTSLYNSRLNVQQNGEYSGFSGYKMFSSIDWQKSVGDFLITAQGGVNRGEDRFIKGTTRQRAPENIEIFSDLYTEWLPFDDYKFQYGAGAQYAMPKDGYISLKYTGEQGLATGNIISTNTITTATSRGDFDVDIIKDENRNTHSLALNMDQPIDTSGSNIFLGGQFYTLQEDINNPIMEASLLDGVKGSRDLKNIVDRDITIASVQLDYRYQKKKNWALETGLKYGVVDNGAFADFLIQQDDLSFIKDENLSNDFVYNENIAAAYADLSFTINKNMNFRTGLRVEHTDYTIAVDDLAEDLTDQYLSFFPSAALDITFSDSYRLGIAYSESIIRQDYNRLNPSLIYQDPYTSIQGNPLLLPEKVRSIELTSLLAGTTVKLGYSYTEDPFSGAAIPGNDSLSYILIRVNNDKRDAYYASISRTFTYKRLSSNISISQFFTAEEETEIGLKAGDPISRYYAYTTHRLDVGKGWNLEALAYYYTPYQDGTINRRPAGNLTLSIDKKFLDDALTVRFIANDIFHSQRADGDYTAGVTDITFRNKWDSNYFRLAATYNFNTKHKAKFKSKSVSGEAVRRAR